MHSEFYYGIPQTQWDELLFQAEDLLRDERLGQHLVGAYPAGDRIYGIDRPPGIMCLYVDSVESLLNPTLATTKSAGPYETNTGPIWMVNLFSWIKWITTATSCTAWTANLLHLIPSGDLLHEDESISDIISLANQYIVKVGPAPYERLEPGPIPLSHYLPMRTILIAMKTGKFYPCINPEWGTVFRLNELNPPTYISAMDQAIRLYIIGQSDEEPTDILQSASHWINQQLKELESGWASARELKVQLGEATASLYRNLI
jgi:hypothetical protein